jgi:hypothetical protein
VSCRIGPNSLKQALNDLLSMQPNRFAENNTREFNVQVAREMGEVAPREWQ